VIISPPKLLLPFNVKVMSRIEGVTKVHSSRLTDNEVDEGDAVDGPGGGWNCFYTQDSKGGHDQESRGGQGAPS
jgi:hypothetical protein